VEMGEAFVEEVSERAFPVLVIRVAGEILFGVREYVNGVGGQIK
jgi:hypothetical protein